MLSQLVFDKSVACKLLAFDITQKDVFAWRFILNENILFWMTITSKTISPFCFCVLFSNMYPKIKLMAKNWSDLCNFYSKVIFLEFLIKKIVFMFLCRIWIIDVSQYCENFRKNDQAELVENLSPSYLTYRFLHKLRSFLLWEKVEIFDFLKTND